MGLRGFFGGLVGIVSGFYVRSMLGDAGPSFPQNYACLYATAAFFLGCCVFSFALVNEPAGYVNTKRASVYQHIIQGISILKTDQNFNFQYLNNLMQAMAIIGPAVYYPYAIKLLGMPESFVGSLLILSAALTLPANFLWSHIGDKHGNRLLLLINTCVQMADITFYSYSTTCSTYKHGISCKQVIIFFIPVTYTVWIMSRSMYCR